MSAECEGVPLVRSHLATREPALARQYMDAAYGASLRLSGRLDGQEMRLDRVGTGRFTIDHLVLPGTLRFSCDPLSRALITVTEQGHLGIDCQGRSDRPTRSTPLLTPDGEPYEVLSETATMRVTALDPGLLHDTLGTPVADRARLRFVELQAADAAAVQLWRSATAFVSGRLSGQEAVPALLSGQLAHLLATTALSLFPHQRPERRGYDSTDATPATLRRAIVYIESHADQDVTLTDIALAACASPRAVQQAFRRHRATTPLGYLRRVRLAHAHRELQTASAGTASVTQIAARWGFAHPSRFAGYYREEFSESPAETLRGAAPES
ncbi:helix-turn-helix transcriptional regulator [Streptomyces sp. NPDC049813]|uniref:helix-turn-helix transcriptional regulator n=1 Tax=Streptomyces sp. NPDC049813 TaxID=3365597 RepID=UPI00378821BB